MTNILDYLKWRGDLPVEQVPLCDVDMLILSRLAYIKMSGIVPESFTEQPVSAAHMAEAVLETVDENAKSSAAVKSRDDISLLRLLIESPRFQNLQLTGHRDIFDGQEQEQFSAVTILLPGDCACIAFRGTDSTLVGWKEDFNMAFDENVPAQEDAAGYVEEAAAALPKRSLCLCGHSKGGNLAVYSAAFCSSETRQRILQVRNFDGPGFNEHNIGKTGVREIRDRTKTYLPQSSVVGMLLEHAEEFTIVHSEGIGIFQHDIYSWEIVGAGFVTEEETTGSSQFIDSALKEWLAGMTPQMREDFVDSVFTVFADCEGETLREMWTGRNALAIVRAAAGMDESRRQTIQEGLDILRSSVKKTLPELSLPDLSLPESSKWFEKYEK
ncbi:MAG: Mbeg1-like protein [Emergencia sp.]